MQSPQRDTAANVGGPNIFVKIGCEVRSGSEILVRRAPVGSALSLHGALPLFPPRSGLYSVLWSSSASLSRGLGNVALSRFLYQGMQPTLANNRIGCKVPNVTPLQT